MPVALGGGWSKPVEAKTSAYSVTVQDCGKFFTNEGAVGSVTFTLPIVSSVHKGWNCEFFTAAGQAIVIASSPTDKLLTHNDATSDSVTTAATIGQHFEVISLGATGYAVVSNPSVATTATAVTAVTIAT